MKKFVSILLAAVILLSGVNISYSMHFCGGKLAASRWTVGKQASCGMKKKKSGAARPFKSDCCKNQDYKYEVDGNYSPSHVLKLELNNIFILAEFSIFQLISFAPRPAVLAPRGEPPLLCPERLCVFRI
ncbi:MAG: hypothetical protein CRN43_05850 [Candidatus Nephrothrix sp. EaCA]|nr:MAG: hypothetical protein CRN43_05850 [Candidatus Nephrothrix sp. EaCA]